MTTTTAPGIIRWEDPPAPQNGKTGGRRIPWARVANTLRHHPGRWALVDEESKGDDMRRQIVAGVGMWAPAGAYEIEVQRFAGASSLWARYVGAEPLTDGPFELDIIIRWEDPPAPAARQRAKPRPWATTSSTLRAHPKRWALVDTSGQGTKTAQRISAGESWWAPAGSFDTATRRVAGVAWLWRRHLGEPPAAAPDALS